MYELNVSDSDDLSALKCSVRAKPSPNITWTYNNQSLPQGMTYKLTTDDDDGTVTYTWLNWTGLATDKIYAGGVYRCEAANTYGHITSRPMILNPLSKF